MIGEIVRDNFRDLAILGGLAAVYYGMTDAQPPSGVSVPEWWPLLGVAGLCAAIGMLFVTGKITDMWPEDHGIYLAVVNDQSDSVIEVWELTEDQYGDLEIIDGPLNHLDDAKHRAYECFAYNPETNTAVGTWRQSVPASKIVGHNKVEDAMDSIGELREHLEPEAKRGRYIRQNLPGILRELDRQRARNQARAIEPTVAPSFGGESINDALDRTLPEELMPSRLADAEDVDEVAEEQGGVSFEILDDEELTEPLAPQNGTNGHE